MGIYNDWIRKMFNDDPKLLREYYSLDLIYTIIEEIYDYLSDSDSTVKDLAKESGVSYRKLDRFLKRRSDIKLNTISKVFGYIRCMNGEENGRR